MDCKLIIIVIFMNQGNSLKCYCDMMVMQPDVVRMHGCKCSHEYLNDGQSTTRDINFISAKVSKDKSKENWIINTRRAVG